MVASGGRGFYLRNEGVLLNQALIQFALHSSYERGSMPIMTPFFMRQDIMGECAQLAQFDEELYKVTGDTWRPNILSTYACLYSVEWLPCLYLARIACLKACTTEHFHGGSTHPQLKCHLGKVGGQPVLQILPPTMTRSYCSSLAPRMFAPLLEGIACWQM